MITRLVLIARNAFRTIMSRRALYIWAAAIILMFLRSAPAVFVQNQDERVMTFIRANAVAGSLDVWSLLCIAAVIFLGAGSVATEMTTKTIVTVMARPVRRWEMLVGKWAGVSLFAIVTMGLGLGLALGLAAYLGIEVDVDPLGLALSHTVVAIVLYGAIAVAIGSFGSWTLAAALTILLAFIPGLITVLQDLDSATWRRVGNTLDWIVPDGYGRHYMAITAAPPPFRRGAAAPAAASLIDYPKERAALGESLAYGVVYFLAGCVAFSRRDLHLG